MRTSKWVGQLAGISLALQLGCAQTPPATTIVQASPAPATEAETSAPPPKSQGAVAVPQNISAGAAEVIRLSSSGVAEDVVLAYINTSQAPFDLSADVVLYLKDLGISSPVVTAMLNHDTALRSQSPPPAQTAPPVVEQPAAPVPPVVEAPMTPTVQSAPPEDVSYFYSDLSPYGTWVVLDGVGWCWQPRTVVISHGWRPYCDGGHWVYSDCGWFWQSDYSWGWAPFHYGRWQMHPRCGWVWTPDRVWGPAWVTWRVAGNNCGWAPLPPHAVFDVHSGWRFNGVHVGVNFDFGLHADHFTFVAVGNFTQHDLGHRVLPVREVQSVYRQTTVINNTTVVNNNIIVNRGIPVERVSAATHTEIHRATLREAPAGPGRMDTSRSPGKGEPVVYRHELTIKPKPMKVVAQKVDGNHAIVPHNELPPVRTERSGSSYSSRYQKPPSTAQPAVRENQPATTHPARPTYPPVVEGPKKPGDSPAQPKKPEAYRPNGNIQSSKPAKTVETYTPVQQPWQTAPLQAPKQSADKPQTGNSSGYRSNPSYGGAHDYKPKGYQPPAGHYSPPSHSEHSQPSSSSSSSSSGSSSRGDSSSHRKDR